MSDNKIFAIRNGARQGMKYRLQRAFFQIGARQGINRSSAMTYLLQRALFAINVRIMLHENKKMEVIK